MLKNTWVKWSLYVTGSMFVVFGFGACVADFLLTEFVLSGVR